MAETANRKLQTANRQPPTILKHQPYIIVKQAKKSFIISWLFLAGVVHFSIAQSGQQSFPTDFTGHWKGTLQWTKTGASQPQSVPMELIIQPSKDSAGQFTWQLIYGSNKADNRPYLLKPVDTAKGHWLIDERNGIALDQYWIAGRLTGVFKVQNATILNNYSINNGQLQVEFITFDARPVRTSGQGTTESPHVDSYEIKSRQIAILSKEKE